MTDVHRKTCPEKKMKRTRAAAKGLHWPPMRRLDHFLRQALYLMAFLAFIASAGAAAFLAFWSSLLLPWLMDFRQCQKRPSLASNATPGSFLASSTLLDGLLGLHCQCWRCGLPGLFHGLHVTKMFIRWKRACNLRKICNTYKKIYCSQEKLWIRSLRALSLPT